MQRRPTLHHQARKLSARLLSSTLHPSAQVTPSSFNHSGIGRLHEQLHSLNLVNHFQGTCAVKVSTQTILQALVVYLTPHFRYMRGPSSRSEGLILKQTCATASLLQDRFPRSQGPHVMQRFCRFGNSPQLTSKPFRF